MQLVTSPQAFEIYKQRPTRISAFRLCFEGSEKGWRNVMRSDSLCSDLLLLGTSRDIANLSPVTRWYWLGLMYHDITLAGRAFSDLFQYRTVWPYKLWMSDAAAWCNSAVRMRATVSIWTKILFRRRRYLQVFDRCRVFYSWADLRFTMSMDMWGLQDWTPPEDAACSRPRWWVSQLFVCKKWVWIYNSEITHVKRMFCNFNL